MTNEKLMNRFNDNTLGYIFPKKIKNMTDDIHITINEGSDIGGFKFAVSPVYIRSNIAKTEEDSFMGYRERRDEIARMGPGINTSTLLFNNQIISLDMNSDTEGHLIFKDVCDMPYLKSIIDDYEPLDIQKQLGITRSIDKLHEIANVLHDNGWIFNLNFLKEKYNKLNFINSNVKGMWINGTNFISKSDISIPVTFENNKEAVNFCQFITMITAMMDGISAIKNPLVFEDEIHDIKHAVLKAVKVHLILSVYCAKFKVFNGIGNPYTSNFIISDPTACLLHGLISSDLNITNYSTYNYALLDSLFDVNNFIDFMINTGYVKTTHPWYINNQWVSPTSLISFIDQEYNIDRYLSSKESSSFLLDTNRLLRINAGSIISSSRIGKDVNVDIVVPFKDVIKISSNREVNLMDLPLDYNKIRGMMISELKHQKVYTVMLLAKLSLLDGDDVSNVLAYNYSGDIASDLIDKTTKKFIKYKDYGKSLCADVKNAFSGLFSHDDLYTHTSAVRVKMTPDKLYRIKRMQFMYESGIKMTHIKTLASFSKDNMRVSSSVYDIPRSIDILMDIFSIAEHTDVFESILSTSHKGFVEIMTKIFNNNIRTLNQSMLRGYSEIHTSSEDIHNGSVDRFIKYIVPIRMKTSDYQESKRFKRMFRDKYEFIEAYDLSDYLHNTLTIAINESQISIINSLFKIGVFDIELKRIRLFRNEISLKNGSKHTGEGASELGITFAQVVSNATVVNSDFTNCDNRFESKLFVLLLTLLEKMMKSAAINDKAFASKLECIVSENLELLRKKVKLISRTTVYGTLMNGVMNMLVLAAYNYGVNDYVEIINRSYNNNEVQNLIAINSATFGVRKYSGNQSNPFGTLYEKVMNFTSYFIDEFIVGFLSFGSPSTVIKYLGGCSNQDLHNVFTSGDIREPFIDRKQVTVFKNLEIFKHILNNKLNMKNILEYIRITSTCLEYINFDLINSKIDESNSIQNVLDDIIKNEVMPKEFKRVIGIDKTDLLPKKIDIVNVEPDENDLYIHFHEHTDESVIYLGNVTNCCQVIGGAAEKCVVEGTINPYSGFISYRNKNGSIIAQSWIWLTHDARILVVDSVESRYHDKVQQITSSLLKWAKAQKYDVAIGSAYSKVDGDMLDKSGLIYVHRRDEVSGGNVINGALNLYDLTSSKDENENALLNTNDVIDYILSHDSDEEIRKTVSDIRSEFGKYKHGVMNLDVYKSHNKNILKGFSVVSASGDMGEVYSDAASFHFLKNIKQK